MSTAILGFPVDRTGALRYHDFEQYYAVEGGSARDIALYRRSVQRSFVMMMRSDPPGAAGA